MKKRKAPSTPQASITLFFGGGGAGGGGSNAINEKNSTSKRHKVVDLTGDDDDDEVEVEVEGDDYDRNGMNMLLSPSKKPLLPKVEIPPEHNAFNKLLAASKTSHLHSTGSGKKVRAVFILYLDCQSKLHPFFTFDTNYLQKPLNEVIHELNPSTTPATVNHNATKEWTCEVTVNHFRWDIFRKEHKELLLTLRTNLPTSSNTNGSSSTAAGGTTTGIGGKGENSEGESSDNHSTIKPIINISLLKSMIQKGVRRKQTKKTMTLTAYLSQCNLQEILRRLPVISVEDVILHPSLPIIVWLMIAVTKGFQPILSNAAACGEATNASTSASSALTYVHQMCALVIGDLTRCEWKDCYPESEEIYDRCYSIHHSLQDPVTDIDPSTGSSSDAAPLKLLSTSTNLPNHNHNSTNTILSLVPNAATRTLVASLLLRRGYGGMGGDMEMLEEYAILWARRFQGTLVDNIPSTPSSSWMQSFINKGFLDEIYQSGTIYGLNGMRWGEQLLHAFGMNNNNRGNSETSNQLQSLPMTFNESVTRGRLHELLEDELYQLHTMAQEGQLTQRKPLIPTLETDDIIFEGLDFHCDWSMPEAIFEKCEQPLRELWKHDIQLIEFMTENAKKNNASTVGGIVAERDMLIAAIKSSIWFFRSSVNVHKLWTIHTEEMKIHQHSLQIVLKKKDILSKVWKIVCPEVINYCTTKLQSAVRQIGAAQRKQHRK